MTNWSEKQIASYNELVDRSRSMPWSDLVLACLPGSQLQHPMPSVAIAAEEQRLGVQLPEELKGFYLLSGALIDDTGANIIMPLKDMVDDNLDLWSGGYDDVYMPFEGVLVFGGPGNGDRYFYPRWRNGNYGLGIFLWDHENDSRTWIASNVKDLLLRSNVERIE